MEKSEEWPKEVSSMVKRKGRLILIGKNTERDGHGGGEEKAVCSTDVKAAHIPSPPKHLHAEAEGTAQFYIGKLRHKGVFNDLIQVMEKVCSWGGH